MSTYFEAACAAGHRGLQQHLDIKDFFEDGTTRLQITYATTQRNSARGRSIRFIKVLREGAVHETELGSADDTRPGWWARHDGVEKFFLSERIISFDMITCKRSHGLCPLVGAGAAAAAAAVGAQPRKKTRYELLDSSSEEDDEVWQSCVKCLLEGGYCSEHRLFMQIKTKPEQVAQDTPADKEANLAAAAALWPHQA
jgi:hypothetical protein